MNKLTLICISVSLFSYSALTNAQVITEDLIITGSTCTGFDCVNGESFGFDTLRLKENNLRIHFDDTSSSASFPSNDWRLAANDAGNGGANYFAVEDSTAGTTPFKVLAGAPNNALYLTSSGNLGLGTATPVVGIHSANGNTPTLRLEQNGSSGFTPQSWDLAGNETNFFIRDVTNGSTLPFRIRPGAPTSSIDIAASGFVGVGVQTPLANVHIRNSDSGSGGRDLLYLSNNGNPQIVLENRFNSNTWRMGGGLNYVVKNGANETLMALAPEGKLTIDSSDAAFGPRDSLVLTNNGNPQILLSNTYNNNSWRMSAGLNYVIKNNAGNNVFTLSPEGNLQLSGALTTAGGSCSGGCDLTFKEANERVKPIEEHAKLMWENSYLPAVGPTKEYEPINVSEKTGAMLHELEVAHIYIEQLHNRMNSKEEQLKSLIERLDKLESKVSQ
jgi:hypothetical protein